jgi:hypothetical protein
MHSPIVAMLWELWRLTRSEYIFRLAISLAVGVFLMTLATLDRDSSGGGDVVVLALFSGAFFHSLLSLALSKLNGGRFLDGYHPGFPLYLLYARPVRTTAIVGVAMTYMAGSAALSYLLWALLMNAAFDVRFPLLPIGAWLAVLQLVQAFSYWATRSKSVQWVGSMGGYLACCALALRRAAEGNLQSMRPDTWPTLFDYGFVDYALIAVIVSVAFGLTVVGVSRQRRGDSSPAKRRSATESGSPGWLDRLFRLPCPTSSATRAQIWFDLKSSGLTILGTGFLAALALLLLCALGGGMVFVRSFALSAPVLAALLVLLMGANAFGIRRRQGRTYASVFDVTQAVGTGSLAGLRILVRSLCVSAAFGMVAASTWIAVSIVNRWPNVGREGAGLQQGRDAVEAALLSMTSLQLFALAILVFGMIVLLVTVRASLEALFARYRRRLIVAAGAILLYGFAFALTGLIDERETALSALARAIFTATSLIVAAAIVSATLYLAWRTVVERLLTPGQTAGAVLISVLFASVWATLTYAGGVRFADMSLAGITLVSLPAVLPLFAAVLAPWSLSRVRHV